MTMAVLIPLLLAFLIPMGLALWFSRDALPMARLCSVLMGLCAGLASLELLDSLAGHGMSAGIAVLCLIASYQLGHLFD